MPARTQAQFYVYRIYDGDQTLYIGKGSGRRLENQMKRFAAQGEVLSWHTKEAAAYKAEVAAIARHAPPLNRNIGGGGSWSQPKPVPRKPKWEREMERIGTRVYAARALLRFAIEWPAELRARIEAVAASPVPL